MVKKFLFLAIYFLSPILPILAIYTSNPGFYGFNGFIPMVLGSIAFTWLNLQLILSSRPKFIESYFGLDKFYKFHGLMAVIAIALAFSHKLLKGLTFSESFTTQLGDVAIIIFIGAAVLALIFMVDTIIKKIKILNTLRTLSKKIEIGKYNVQVILHNLNVIAVIFVFLHVMLTNSAKNPIIKTVYTLYFVVSISFYLYHKIIKRYLFQNKFIIKEIIQESESMWTLKMYPVKGKVMDYKPGQFGFIRIIDNGISSEEHPFSISSQPLNKEYISITIKNLGDWTANIKNVKSGNTALLDAPYGRFSPMLYNYEGGIVLIVGGVGITPILSILRYFYEFKKDQKITLFWGINSISEIICSDEFDLFSKEMKNFSLIPVVAKDKDFAGEKGFINQEKLERLIKSEDGLEHLQYFICGPAIMQMTVLKSLKSMGINNSKLHYESFSL